MLLVHFPSLLRLRPSRYGRDHQASDEISPPHGFPPLWRRIVTWQRCNAHGRYWSCSKVQTEQMSSGLCLKADARRFEYTPKKRVLMANNPCSPHDPNGATDAAVLRRLGDEFARVLLAAIPRRAAV